MKSLKLVIIAAIGCMSVVFISGSAHAQLLGIIDDYCAEVARGADEALGEPDEATADLMTEPLAHLRAEVPAHACRE